MDGYAVCLVSLYILISPLLLIKHSGVVVVHEFRVANAIDDPDALVQYPDEAVVAPPLPRTQRDATNISGMSFPQFSIQERSPTYIFLRRRRGKMHKLVIRTPTKYACGGTVEAGDVLVLLRFVWSKTVLVWRSGR